MNRPTVWVIKEQVRRDGNGPVPMDYSPAEKFGDIRFVTEFDLPVYPRGTLATRWSEQVKKFIEEFDESQDWVVLTGAPLSIFMVGVVMGSIGKEPRVLVWRREQQEYVPFDTGVTA